MPYDAEDLALLDQECTIYKRQAESLGRQVERLRYTLQRIELICEAHEVQASDRFREIGKATRDALIGDR